MVFIKGLRVFRQRGMDFKWWPCIFIPSVSRPDAGFITPCVSAHGDGMGGGEMDTHEPVLRSFH